ncbi:hypothetical protein [Leptolyngbya iicbica]|uniref:Uncharacterized protein n=1 Tax=Lyngbya confervoides BDU141951 TaxID=1574623 RepID=A0A8T6QLH3_9CYAN|nr:hypothetical protein [Leptolyngbya sp. LK]
MSQIHRSRLKPEKQLDNLLEWFQLMQAAGLPEKESVGVGAIARLKATQC